MRCGEVRETTLRSLCVQMCQECLTKKEEVEQVKSKKLNKPHLKPKTFSYLCTKLTASICCWMNSVEIKATLQGRDHSKQSTNCPISLTIGYPEAFQGQVQLCGILKYMVGNICTLA